MIAQYINGEFHFPIGIGGGLYLLPFEGGEIYIYASESGGRYTRNQSGANVPCSLEGNKLPFVWGSTVGSRKGLMLYYLHMHRGVTAFWTKYTYERLSSRLVRLKEETYVEPKGEKFDWIESYAMDLSERKQKYNRTRYAFDPNNRRHAESPQSQYSFYRHTDVVSEVRKSGTLVTISADPIGIEPGKGSESINSIVEVLEMTSAPLVVYQNAVLAIPQRYPVLATNMKCRMYKGKHCLSSPGFGGYALVNFNGRGVLFLNHISPDAFHEYRAKTPEPEQAPDGLLEKLVQLRAEQKKREAKKRQEWLDQNPKSYQLEDHDGMVVCMAIMHDGSRRVASIREIKTDRYTGEILVELGSFYHTVRVNPLVQPFVKENGLKGFFASSTDLEKEANKVVEKRKAYWRTMVGKAFVIHEQVQKNRLPELVAYFVVEDDELGGKPVRCPILDSNARLPGVRTDGTYVKILTPSKREYHILK